jgi:hypothetical protein
VKTKHKKKRKKKIGKEIIEKKEKMMIMIRDPCQL